MAWQRLFAARLAMTQSICTSTNTVIHPRYCITSDSRFNIFAVQPPFNVSHPIVMPLNYSTAHSSRVSKRPQQQLLRRSASSPFTNLVQKKSIQRSQSKPEVVDDDDDDSFGDRLADIGTVKSLASDPYIRDVTQTIQYVRSHMFDALPENGGFNSTRIADILSTFSRSL